MLSRIIECVLVYAPVLLFTLPALKNRGRKEKFVYALLLCGSVYWALMYVLQKPWPNFNDLAEIAFEKPATWLTEYLKRR